jgi:hypothetical protein
MRASHCAPTRYKVDDENHERDYKEQMDQASCDMQAKSQDPEDQEDHKNRPKHSCRPLQVATPGKTVVLPGAWVSEFVVGFELLYFRLFLCFVHGVKESHCSGGWGDVAV